MTMVKDMTITIDSLQPRPKCGCDGGYDVAVKDLSAVVITRVMMCVKSVSFSVKVNGALSESFKPTRGIRQGDPISPIYFFCARKDYLAC